MKQNANAVACIPLNTSDCHMAGVHSVAGQIGVRDTPLFVNVCRVIVNGSMWTLGRCWNRRRCYHLWGCHGVRGGRRETGRAHRGAGGGCIDRNGRQGCRPDDDRGCGLLNARSRPSGYAQFCPGLSGVLDRTGFVPRIGSARNPLGPPLLAESVPHSTIMRIGVLDSEGPQNDCAISECSAEINV